MAASETTHTVPAQWPGAFGLYQHSKKAVQTNLGTILSLIVLLIFIPGTLQSLGGDEAGFSRTFFELVSYVASTFLGVSMTVTLLKSVGNHKIELLESLQQGPKYFLNYLVLNILTVIILFISLLLLIVPFFIVLPRISLAPYFLIDKNLDAVAALQASWDATRGKSSNIWAIIGVNFLMILLIFTIIGIPFAIYYLVMYSAATAIYYKLATTKAKKRK